MSIPRDVSEVRQKLSDLLLVLKSHHLNFHLQEVYKGFCQQFVLLFICW